ncbi:hypothetical protein GGX14DRAFT_405285 [Mycena pura]|uniref:Uncharacterized protein n=1 Tax=Mycena pura TaxID=153505 RepID=A0AAD6UVW7_9AGAR|nr:hypothetical protein GGX14DRAFT_405285 [Mycena pura]
MSRQPAYWRRKLAKKLSGPHIRRLRVLSGVLRTRAPGLKPVRVTRGSKFTRGISNPNSRPVQPEVDTGIRRVPPSGSRTHWDKKGKSNISVRSNKRAHLDNRRGAGTRQEPACNRPDFRFRYCFETAALWTDAAGFRIEFKRLCYVTRGANWLDMRRGWKQVAGGQQAVLKLQTSQWDSKQSTETDVAGNSGDVEAYYWDQGTARKGSLIVGG